MNIFDCDYKSGGNKISALDTFLSNNGEVRFILEDGFL